MSIFFDCLLTVDKILHYLKSIVYAKSCEEFSQVRKKEMEFKTSLEQVYCLIKM